MNVNIRLLSILLFGALLSCNSEKKEVFNQDLEKEKLPPSNLDYGRPLSEVMKSDFTQDTILGIDLTKRYPLEVKKTTKYVFENNNVDFIKKFTLDENGVPIKNKNYFPTTIAQVGAKAFNRYKEDLTPEAKKILLNQAKWAKDHFYHNDNYGFWVFKEPKPLYRIDKTWTSAMGQAEMISLCLGAYDVTKDKDYLEIIEKALKAFLIPIEEGGFTRTWGKGQIWYEEYATSRPSRVLNGNIYALAGIYQVYEATGSSLALQIFEAGAKTLRNYIHLYDAKYTSRYSLADWKNELSKENYHEGHVLQLLWLYNVTGELVFKKYAKRFLENDRNDFKRYSPQYRFSRKIDTIIAKHCIDCEKKGPNNLYDEKWAHGYYWSSHRDSEIVIDFGKVRQNISAITLYHVTKRSSNVNFKLYANYNENNWELIQNYTAETLKDIVYGYNVTGKYETFIKHYKIYESLDAKKLKLVFESDKEKVIALREINFIYDRSEDLERLNKQIKEDISYSRDFFN